MNKLLLLNSNIFEGNTNYRVPKEPPNIRDFIEYVENDIDQFKVDWEIENITGYVTINGEYTVSIYRNVYYLLDKFQSFGGGRYKYKLIRWFWVNDCLLNKDFSAEGIIEKTSDQNLVYKNIIHTTPIHLGGSKMTYYNIGDLEEDIPKTILLSPDTFFHSSNSHFLGYDSEILQFPKVSGNFKYMLAPSVHLNWKGYFLRAIVKYLQDNNISLYDFNTVTQHATIAKLSELHNQKNAKFYVLAKKNYNSVRVLADREITSKYIEKIDLSNLIDIVKLDPTNFQPESINLINYKEISSKSKVNQIKNTFTNIKFQKINTDPIIKFNDNSYDKIFDSLGKKKQNISDDGILEIIGGYHIIRESNEIKTYNPIYKKFFLEPKSKIINLDRYNIMHKSSEVDDNSLLNKDYINFLVGQENIFDNNTFLNTALTVAENNQLYILYIKKFDLYSGWTIDGKPYATYAIMEPIYEEKPDEDPTISGVRIVNDSKLFQESNNFLKIKQKTRQIFSSQLDINPNEYEISLGITKNLHKEIGDPELNFSKSETKQIFKDLINNMSSDIVGTMIIGVIVQLPDSNQVNNFITSTSEIGDYHKPLTAKQYIYMNPWPDISWATYNLKKHRDEFLNYANIKNQPKYSTIEIQNAGEPISYNELKVKVDEWFKLWPTNQNESDFYLNKKISYLNTHERFVFLCYDLFKIYQGKQYKLTFIFRKDPKQNDVNNINIKIIHRKLEINEKVVNIISGLYRYNEELFVHININTPISDIIYWLYIYSKLPNFDKGTWNLDLEKNKLGRLPIGIVDRGPFVFEGLHEYEMYRNVIYDVTTWEKTIKIGVLSYAQNILTNKIITLDKYNIWYGDKKIEWTEEDGLYDLVGTNFYVYKSKNYFELIIKQSSETIMEKKPIEKGVFTSSPLTDLTQIINSSNTLYAFGYYFPLNFRGIINNNFKFDTFSLTPIDLDSLDAPYDVYELMITVEGEILKQIIQVIKKPAALSSNISIADKENISYRIRQEQRLSALNLETNNLNAKRFYAELNLKKQELDYEAGWKNWGLIGGLMQNFLNIGMYLKNKPKGLPLGLISSSLNFVDTFKSYKDTQFRHMKAANEYEISKRFGSEEFRLKTEQANINFALADAQSKKQLFDLDTSVRISTPTESSLYRALKEKNKTGDIYLINVCPQGKQLEELNKYYKEFGYDAIIRDYVMKWDDIQEGFIVKFAQVTSIEGIKCPIITQAVKTILESGIKVF